MAIGRLVVQHRQANLPKIVRTGIPPRCLAGSLDCRKEQCHEDPNDGDHHEQFDQGKTMSGTTAKMSAT
jgi:hypothetical protein